MNRVAGWVLSLLPPAVVVVLMTWLINTGEWTRFGVAPMPLKLSSKTSFGDLIAFTSMADCVTTGTDITTCDPYGRPFQPYIAGPARVLSMLHLGVANTEQVGFALLAIYAVAVLVLARTTVTNWRRHPAELVAMLVVFTLAAISPPAMLVIERGQLDIVILLALAVGLLLVAKKNPLLQSLGTLLLVWGAYAKYFALGVFLPFLARKRASVAGILGLVMTVALMALTWGDITIARASSRSDIIATSRTMFGASALPTTWLVHDPMATEVDPTTVPARLTLVAAGVALLAVLAALWLIVLRRTRSARRMDAPSWTLLVGGVGALLGPFLLGLSYDYRLIVLLLPLAGAMRWRASGGPAPTTWLLLLLATTAMATAAWMVPSPSGWLMPREALMVGDLALTAVLAAGAAMVVEAWLPTHRNHNRHHNLG